MNQTMNKTKQNNAAEKADRFLENEPTSFSQLTN